MSHVVILLALALTAGAIATPVAVPAPAPSPSPFTLNSRWTLDFRQAGTGRSVSRAAFTVVSVEQSAGTVTAFGLVGTDPAFSVVAVMNAQDGTLTVTELRPLDRTPRQLRLCAFGTDRPPLRSGLTVTVPTAQLSAALGTLRREWTTVRATRPKLSTLAALRVAAGVTTDGAICTVRRTL